MAAMDAGIADATRWASVEFDDLLGPLLDGTPEALQRTVNDLRDFLVDRRPVDELRQLWREFGPCRGSGNVPGLADSERLAIRQLKDICSAMHCDSKRAAELILGKAGARDQKRQAGTRKERRPDVTQWIDGQLRTEPNARAPALWARAPEWLTEQIGIDRFRKRVTACRKLRRK